MAVAFEKLGVELIEQLAEKVIGEIIQAIENLITNKADNPIREAFTQEQVGKAMALVNEPTNCMVIFEHDKHDASDLIKNGWKMGKINLLASCLSITTERPDEADGLEQMNATLERSRRHFTSKQTAAFSTGVSGESIIDTVMM
ncbi:uncharacterized protein KY384_002302 [Bacidia gigantensis]|uniref:uncharacterized protein n=1 Tax=Bacidia gigantensis TaxID=2732470 RepID=UPI001D05573A|nr:uncharacterized protein KY384_002302 [Bacidia gigantensis]KAG8533516.1 hypothetical protein KY384_002302 [Bacidia gigantensis]